MESKPNFSQIFVLRKLKSEKDLQIFCQEQISKRSKLYHYQVGYNGDIVVKPLPKRNHITLCQDKCAASLINNFSNTIFKRNSHDNFKLQRILDIAEDKIEINGREIDVKVVQSQAYSTGNFQFNIKKI